MWMIAGRAEDMRDGRLANTSGGCLTAPCGTTRVVLSVAALVEVAAGKERSMTWGWGSDPTLGAAVGASEAKRAERTAAIAEDKREEEHESEDYEAAKVRAGAAPRRSLGSRIVSRILGLLRLGR
jgi:hypothetical protein